MREARAFSAPEALVVFEKSSHSAESIEVTFSAEIGSEVAGTYRCVAMWCDLIADCVTIVKLYGKSF